MADDPRPYETPDEEGISAELSFLEQLLGDADSQTREELAQADWLRDEIELAQPRERYRPLGPALTKVAIASVATFPAVLAAAPSFANTTLPYNMMIAMAERPPAAPLAPMLGNAGTQLFPFSRPMRAVRQHVASPVPLVASVNLPLNPRLQTIFSQQRKVVLTSKAKAACTFYQVAAGDSLYAIAADLLGSGARWREIYEANKAKITRGYTVYPGMRLVIPTPRQIQAPTMLAKAHPAAPHTHAGALHAKPTAIANRYHVERGDSLYVIAQKALHDPARWREILALNKQTLQGKTLIYPNQWLVLPSES